MGYAIEAEIYKLKSLFMQVSTQPTDIEVTEPEVVKPDSSEIYKHILQSLKTH
jgi:hypothetical protein